MKNNERCRQTRHFKGVYSCDNYADVYVGDCNEVQRKIASNSSLEAVQFEAKATCEAYIYFVCWSDNAGLNGLLAELHGANAALSGTSDKWEVFPTGIDFSSHTTRPSEKLINTELKKAHCKKWKKVAKGPNNGKGPFRPYSTIDKAAHFIWYDSGKHTSAGAPFQGFNHDEFLIFRFPIKELFKEECYQCNHECECVDDCHCSECADSITQERKILKEEALGKTFLIKGKENNSRRCKTPYSQETCSTLDLPTLEPCFYLHWGDSTKDQMETHDDEVLYLTACNPYSNLRFRGLTVTKVSILYKNSIIKHVKRDNTEVAANLSDHISIGDPNGPVKPIEPIVPIQAGSHVVKDGSIQIVPNRLLHFGDLCGCSCASQALYLSIQNAKPQEYEIVVEYCIEQIEINQDNTGKTQFPITLIKS